jgi:hypothetical protein
MPCRFCTMLGSFPAYIILNFTTLTPHAIYGHPQHRTLSFRHKPTGRVTFPCTLLSKFNLPWTPPWYYLKLWYVTALPKTWTPIQWQQIKAAISTLTSSMFWIQDIYLHWIYSAFIWISISILVYTHFGLLLQYSFMH